MRIIKRFLCMLCLAGMSYALTMAQENQSYFLHTIEKGQSLYSIASMYGISQADIVKLNPGSDEKIYIGRTLRIPRKTDNTQKETFHTIAAGETLYRLTVDYNVTAKAICDANPGLSAENFRIGQVIRIPTSDTSPKESPQTATPKNDIPPAIQSRCREMHKVKRKETVYSISRLYGITEDELLAANPELEGKTKIKRGKMLCIPYTTTAQTKQPEKLAATPTDKELFNENRKEEKSYKTIKTAVILPFLDVSRGESSRMVEYYEGFLMAIDSLKRSGISIDLHTYNSGPEKNSLNTLLAQKELKDMDIIFGPAYHQHIAPLAEFAQKHNIRLVIPFTSKDNTVFQNPAVYQINTPQSYLYSEVYDHFVRQFPNANVIFIEANQDTRDKAEFIQGLKEVLKSRSFTTSSLKEDNISPESLKALLANGRINLFIPTSSSNLILLKLLPQLILVVREQLDYDIHLFGYPEWQTYTKDHLEAFFELDTYFYSSFYTNNLLPAAVNFTRNYRKWYGKEMEERYPKYGMLGFDTGYFFLKGLSQYGTGFEANMHKLNLIPIQTGFKFQRVNNWGGFINKKVFFVHFTKNFELLKLDFD